MVRLQAAQGEVRARGRCGGEVQAQGRCGHRGGAGTRGGVGMGGGGHRGRWGHGGRCGHRGRGAQGEVRARGEVWARGGSGHGGGGGGARGEVRAGPHPRTALAGVPGLLLRLKGPALPPACGAAHAAGRGTGSLLPCLPGASSAPFALLLPSARARDPGAPHPRAPHAQGRAWPSSPGARREPGLGSDLLVLGLPSASAPGRPLEAPLSSGWESPFPLTWAAAPIGLCRWDAGFPCKRPLHVLPSELLPAAWH